MRKSILYMCVAWMLAVSLGAKAQGQSEDAQSEEAKALLEGMVDYMQGHNPAIKKLVETFAGMAKIKPSQLNSVLGRHLSRAICGAVIADFLLAETERLDPYGPSMADLSIPASAEGFGATEASRGGLLHYIQIENHKIQRYECVVPTTWNASPRDDQGNLGAMETALIGTKVENPEEQIEALRIVHSFDPCIACAVH